MIPQAMLIAIRLNDYNRPVPIAKYREASPRLQTSNSNVNEQHLGLLPLLEPMCACGEPIAKLDR